MEKQRGLKRFSSGKSMTVGNPWKLIISFAIPLLIGNLFQQLYNTVDSVIVGRYVGKEALAAVGSSNSLINLIIGLFIGLSSGAGVLIAQYYGGKEEKKLHWAVHTAICLSIFGGIILTIVGFFASRWLLILMDTPETVIGSSTLYLQIFFMGSLFNLVYNMGAGILRAVGDSITPLCYLIVASLVNICLDILFVTVFHMGVAGVGLATIMAQAISAILVLRKLIRSNTGYRLVVKQIKIDFKMAKRVVGLGLPSGIQSSIVSLSNVVVQANINSFGDVVMAGCSSYMKVDGFVILPIASFSMAAMTFIGQNIGAGEYKRAKKGLFATTVMGCAYILAASSVLLLFGEKIIGIFSNEKMVVYYGMQMLKILIPFYLTIAIVNIFAGAFRGAGRSFAAMLITAGNLCGVRMLWVNIMTPLFPTIETVLWGYPVSWVSGAICAVLYATKGKWLVKRID